MSNYEYITLISTFLIKQQHNLWSNGEAVARVCHSLLSSVSILIMLTIPVLTFILSEAQLTGI